MKKPRAIQGKASQRGPNGGFGCVFWIFQKKEETKLMEFVVVRLSDGLFGSAGPGCLQVPLGG